MKQEEEKDRSAMRERNQSAKVNVPHGSKDTGQDLKKERKTKERTQIPKKREIRWSW
jgi:hypothetical protein